MLLGRTFWPATRRAWQGQQLSQQAHFQGARFLSQKHNLSSPLLPSATTALPGFATAATAQLARRARVPPVTSLVLSGRRWETSTTGDDKSGHIASSPGEGIIFLDNVFPLRIGNLLAWRPWRTSADYNDGEISQLLKRFTKDPDSNAPAPPSPPSTTSFMVSIASVLDPVSLVKRAIPDSLDLTVSEIIPRLKDGGVFVKFRHPADTNLEEIESRLAKSLEAHPVRPWFNPLWGCMRAGLVRGVPWLEDLASRVPSSRVRVEFCAPPAASSGSGGVGDASGSANLELSHETLYGLFRRYGKIAEISSLPFESKTLPRYATIDFMRLRDAVMARSCLHGFVVSGTTRLRTSYEPRARAHHIWDWLTSHPRIVIPILAALLATITVAVFDPIRSFFIRAHVQHSFALRDSQLWKWLQGRTSAFVAYARNSYDTAADNMGIGNGKSRKGPGTNGQDALMTHRRDLLDALRTWLLETSETFIVVQGPRGSGKNELVIDQALKGRKDVLVIDCKPIVEARGESATIKRIATAIGYRPVFSWANNLSSLVDLAVQGTTGVKTGFSETLDEQLSKILQTATSALREVSLDGRHKTDVDADLNEDAYLEAHPERRAVIVLDNFGHRNEDASGPVYDKLAEWAATLVQGNIAHVVFLTSDTSYPKALVKAMPDRVFRQIALGDLSPEVAMNYVLSHLAEKEEEEEEVVAATGGAEEPQPDQPETPASTAAADIAIDAKKAREKAHELAAQPKQQSILDKVIMPFQKSKADGDDTSKTTTTADSRDADAAQGALAPPTEKKLTEKAVAKVKGLTSARKTKRVSGEPSTINTAAAKAALGAEGGVPGIISATASQSQVSPEHQDVIRELDGCIGVLGGRLTDLESLVRRLKSGQSPKRAVSEIVEQSASEIIKMFLLSQPKTSSASSGSGSSSSAPAAAAASPPSSRAWTAEQAWYLVREIGAKGGDICYNDILLSDTFASSNAGIAAIDALAAAELVTVKSFRGRPQSIKAGSPVYLAAFQFLCSDAALAARLDRGVLAEKADTEAKTVAKVEQELALLGTLSKQPQQTIDRMRYLLDKLQESQAKIRTYEVEMARLKKIMSETT
ncbi:mitochondrial escape protein [Sporothrix schenckii 1099-18]|uniref:Mitochondrial escape protein 2 n=1 Tax=Sporothrix schenckii 1099-18 TaxID=1397361 RepID=A0A0F2M8H0_SPOSC|nr:mitochondrial escape protein [Sporothrix schenckii 1099-18]KJR85404.1 mitochondrial escape protein [Sporothrix schenckii 1099-18]